jgi:hypothetical protein
VREADDLVADPESLDAGADLGDHAGQVAALAGGKCRRPTRVQKALADHGLAGVDPGRLHAHDDLALAGLPRLDVDDVQDVGPAVLIKSHRLWHLVLLRGCSPSTEHGSGTIHS